MLNHKVHKLKKIKSVTVIFTSTLSNFTGYVAQIRHFFKSNSGQKLHNYWLKSKQNLNAMISRGIKCMY